MSAAPRRVALFGGSFDPPHLAHQMACLYALSCQPIDEVWLVPTFQHAFDKPLSPFADRVRMCELLAAPLGAAVTVSTVEEDLARQRGTESRTYHTLVELQARHPTVSFRLLVGEDVLAERARWFRWDDVVRMAPPIVVGRVGAPSSGEEPALRLPAISSSDIRAAVARGEPCPLVPRAVMDYIARRGLYL